MQASRIGQIWVMVVVSFTMLAYQNCAQSPPSEAINGSSSTPTPTPNPDPLPTANAFSSITGVSGAGGERVYAVVQGNDLNMYLVGNANPTPGTASALQGMITKLSPTGQLLWSKVYGGPQVAADQFFSAIIDSDGHLVVAGLSRSFAASQADNDGLLMKINRNDGAVIWSRTYKTAGHDEFFAVKAIPGGGYAVAGKTSTAIAAAEDALIMRLDSAGAVQWSRSLGGAQTDRFTDLLVTLQGGLIKIIAGGFTQSYGTPFVGALQREAMMAKFNDAGGVEWQRIYGGSVEDRLGGIVETADKANYVIALKADVAATNGADTVVAKLNLNGTLVSAHSLGMNFFDEAYDIIRTTDGNFVVASTTSNAVDHAPGSDFNVRLTKISANLASVEWNRVYGKSNEDEGLFSGLVQRADGGYAVGAISRGYSAGTDDAMLIQTDELGRVNSAVACMEVQSPAQTITATTITDTAFTPSVNAVIAVTRTNHNNSVVADLGVTQVNACVP